MFHRVESAAEKWVLDKRQGLTRLHREMLDPYEKLQKSSFAELETPALTTKVCEEQVKS